MLFLFEYFEELRKTRVGWERPVELARGQLLLVILSVFRREVEMDDLLSDDKKLHNA